jgi:diguanylate cyclase (GGDEF)-like protein/PAS domain S-box-containing protein
VSPCSFFGFAKLRFKPLIFEETPHSLLANALARLTPHNTLKTPEQPPRPAKDHLLAGLPAGFEPRNLIQAVEQSPVSIIITDPNGNIEYVNPRFTQLTGYSLDEVLGQNPRVLKTDLTPPETHRQLWSTISAGREWRGEFVNHKKDGSFFFELATISPITNANGAITHYLAIKEDITERKQLEEELRTSAVRWRALFEHTHDAVLILDLEGHHISANQQALDLLGYTLDELLALSITDTSAEIEKTQNITTRLLAGEQIPLYERRFRKKNGQIFPAEVNVHLIQDHPGSPAYIQSTTRDISERKQAEAIIRESEQRYRLISENVADVIWVLDLSTQKFTYVSPSVKKLRGFTVEEVMAQPIQEVMTPASLKNLLDVLPARMAVFQQGGNGNHVYIDRIDQLHKAGHVVHTEVTSSFMLKDSGSIEVVGVSRDISESLVLEEAIQKSERRFRALMENSSDALTILNEIAEVVYEGPNNINLTGYAQGERYGKNVWASVHPDDLPMMIEALKRVAARPFHQEKAETRLFTKSHRLWWAEITGTNLLQHPDVQGIVLNYHDITERKLTEQVLSESEIRFRDLFEIAPIAYLTLDRQGNCIDFNTGLCNLLRYSPDELLDRPFKDLYAPEMHPDFLTMFTRFQEEGTINCETRLQTKDHSLLDVVMDGRIQHNSSGEFEKAHCTFYDITERKRNAALLQASEARFRALFEQMHEGIFIFNPDGSHRMANDRAAEMLGCTLDELQAVSFNDIFGELSLSKLGENWGLMQRLPMYETVVVRKNGELLPVEVSLEMVRDRQARPLHIQSVVRDISKRKQVEEELLRSNLRLNEQLKLVSRLTDQLQEQSLRDPLTGLYNRRHLNEFLPREIMRAKRKQSRVSVIIGDVDHFKSINDSYGHLAGDEVLKTTAAILTESLRGSDIVCRYGGEEFLLILPEADSLPAARRAEQIRQKCADTLFQHKGLTIRITISFGVATYPDHAQNLDDLLNKADKALYISKNLGRNQVTTWSQNQAL